MIQLALDTCLFRVGRGAYLRNSALGWLLFGGFLTCALAVLVASAFLLPGYDHTFTLYLKWQDALVALCWYIALLSLTGCGMVLRYLHALRMGYTREMITLSGVRDGIVLTVRDLSHKNLGSIFWGVGTFCSSFLAALAGLVPLMLLGWTISWSHPLLAVLGTGLALLLSVAGLIVAIPVISVIVAAFIGCLSFCRTMGAARTYRLNGHAMLMIHDFELSILSPGSPESAIELGLLNTEDRRLLLQLLRERWLDAERAWNPRLDEEIATALKEAELQEISA